MKTDKTICSVLIIDDDDDLCRILTTILQKKLPVHVEHTLKSAETYLTNVKPVIILLDNNLPDGTGVTSIKDILELYPDIKIVLMTADISEGLKEKALHEGAVSFISKPFRASYINDFIFSICPELRAA